MTRRTPSHLISGKEHGWLPILIILGALLLKMPETTLAGSSLTYCLAPGERLIYKLEYRNDSTADLRPLFQTPDANAQQPATTSGLVQAFRITARGDIAATCLEKNSQGLLIVYSLRNLVITIHANGQEAAEQAAAIQKQLSREIFAAVNFQGRVLGVRFDESVDKAAQNFARALLGVTQFVLPREQKPSYPAWKTTEEDTAGEYIAHYVAQSSVSKKRKSQLSCRLFLKRKLRYLIADQKQKPGEFSLARSVKPQSHIIGCFDAQVGRLISLNGSETQITSMGQQQIARSDTLIKLEFASREIANEAEIRVLKATNATNAKTARAIPLSEMPSEEEITITARRNTLGDATLKTLLDELAAKETTEQKDELSLYLKFRALTFLHPETCEPLGKRLAMADINSLTFKVLSNALGEAGNPQAQTALVSAIRSRLDDWRAVLQLIPVLAQAAHPTSEAEDLLRELAFTSSDANITSTAQLALGVASRNLAESSPARAQKITDSLLEKIASTTSQEEIRVGLLALGNAGSLGALPVLTRYVNDPSPELRAAAVSALRFIQSAQADKLLRKALLSDSQPKVRREAAQALGFRVMTAATFQTQKEALLKDRDESVRLALLRNLAKAGDKAPAICVLIKCIAAQDPAKEVRQKATEILREFCP